MQAVSMAFFANKSFLSNKHVSFALKLGYFDSVVSAVACFAAAHRKFYERGLQCMDVICRKLFGCGGACWNEHVREQMALYSLFIVSKFGRSNVFWNVGNLEMTLLCLMEIVG